MFTSCGLVSTLQRLDEWSRTHVQTEVDLVASELPDVYSECSMGILVCDGIRTSSHHCILGRHSHNIPDCNAIEKNYGRKR
jgi:hypothetical protein